MFNSNNNKVIICLEHPVRELEQAVILKIALEKNEIICDIASTVYNTHLKLLKPAKVILSPWGYGDHEYNYIFGFAEKLYNGFKKIIFWQEQIFNIYEKEFFTPKGKMITDVDAHIVWGRNFALFLKEIGVPPEKIFICGSPRIDLLTHLFDPIFHSRDHLAEEFHLSLDRKWLFFACNFSILFQDKRLEKTLITQGYKNRAKAKQYFKELFVSFIDGIHKISEYFGDDIDIIVRPHPGEPIKYYKEKLKDLNNVKIISKYTIGVWLRNIDILGITTSTTAMEAASIGKKVLRFALPKEDTLLYEFLKYVPTVKNEKELIELVKKALKNDSIENYWDTDLYNEMLEYIKNTYYEIDGSSFLRIMGIIENLNSKTLLQKKLNFKQLFNTCLYCVKDIIKMSVLKYSFFFKYIFSNFVDKRNRDYISSDSKENVYSKYNNIVKSRLINFRGVKIVRKDYGNEVEILEE